MDNKCDKINDKDNKIYPKTIIKSKSYRNKRRPAAIKKFIKNTLPLFLKYLQILYIQKLILMNNLTN